MQIFLFFALFIAILAIIFAIQNNADTSVSFFIWDADGSLALVLLVAMISASLGACFGAFIMSVILAGKARI